MPSDNEVCLLHASGVDAARERRHGPASPASSDAGYALATGSGLFAPILHATYKSRANKREWSLLWSHSGDFLLPDTTRKVDAAKKRPQVQRVTPPWLISNTAFIALPGAGAGRFLLLCHSGFFFPFGTCVGVKLQNCRIIFT